MNTERILIRDGNSQGKTDLRDIGHGTLSEKFIQGELINIKGLVFRVHGIRPNKLILKRLKRKGEKN